jgi:hypothetical protein
MDKIILFVVYKIVLFFFYFLFMFYIFAIYIIHATIMFRLRLRRPVSFLSNVQRTYTYFVSINLINLNRNCNLCNENKKQ